MLDNTCLEHHPGLPSIIASQIKALLLAGSVSARPVFPLKCSGGAKKNYSNYWCHLKLYFMPGLIRASSCAPKRLWVLFLVKARKGSNLYISLYISVSISIISPSCLKIKTYLWVRIKNRIKWYLNFKINRKNNSSSLTHKTL